MRKGDIRGILEIPAVYRLYQSIIGGPAGLKRITSEFVRPFPGARILDIGCGLGTVIEYLPKDMQYVGCDTNSKCIASARRKYKDRGEFLCKRANEMSLHSLVGEFDFVLAFAVLHHVDDSEAADLVRCAHAHLKSGGVLVTMDPVYVPDQSRIARFIASHDRGRHVRWPDEYTSLVSEMFSTVEPTVLTDMHNIPCTVFIMRAVK